MTTLDATIWLLIKEHAEPETILKRFTSFYRLDEQLDFLWLCLYYATQSDHDTLVLSILEHTSDEIKDICHVLTKDKLATCMNEAIRKGNHRLIRIFLDNDPELCTMVGSFYTTESRFKLAYSPIGLAIFQDKVDTLALMLEYYSGVSIGPERQTPLHLACRCPASGCLDLLLANRKTVEQINTKDIDGWTPVLYSARYHPDAIPALLRHGADVSASCDKLGNLIQILSNGCIRVRIGSYGDDDDPCPTLARRRNMINTPSDEVYIPDNFVSLAKTIVQYGVDVNAESTALSNFAANVPRRSSELRENPRVREIFQESVSYLTEVSGQTARDGTLLKLCHAVNFVATQLRRCHDYDNMVGYLDLLPFVGDLMGSLIEGGADAGAKEVVESGEKKIRAFQFLLPFAHPCCSSLKKLISREFRDQTQSARFSSTIDIMLVAILGLYPLRMDEPELYGRAVRAAADMTVMLSGSGARCWQTLHLFTCLCIDPEIGLPLLHDYLNCHSQEHYHDTLSLMQDYMTTLSSDELIPFGAIRKEVAACQNRIYTLKQLVKRDVVTYLGGRLHVDKVTSLPLPSSLKSYLIS